MTTDAEYNLARALVETHVRPDVAPVVLGALDAWHARAREAAAAGGHVEHLTVRQVADRLQVHPSHVYKLIGAGELPQTRVGHAVRIPAAAVQQYLEARTTRAERRAARPARRTVSPDDAATVHQYPWLAG